MAPTSSSQKLFLTSSDGDQLQMDVAAARLSKQLASLMDENLGLDVGNIPLPNASSKVLRKIIEYCKKHSEAGASVQSLKEWDKEFVTMDSETLIGVMSAASYMTIQNLLDLTCETMADRIKDKSPEEVREMFHLINDYTPEEEADLRKEVEWAFECQ